MAVTNGKSRKGEWKMNRKIMAAVLAVLITGCTANTPPSQTTAAPPETSDTTTQGTTAQTTQDTTQQTTEETTQAEPAADVSASDIVYLSHPSMIKTVTHGEVPSEPKVQYQTAAPDLSNVYFGNYTLYGDFSDARKELLAKNGFFLSEYSYGMNNREFFGQYEYNRYEMLASYITADSMMHTYHMYFQHLLKKTEQEHLASDMLDVSNIMLEKAQAHYDALAGTEWENAAKMELAFFSVGRKLLDPSAEIPAAVEDVVTAELAYIDEASSIYYSNILTEKMEDYSQYKPRGYYDSSEDLKRYFRAMMWYGRMGFESDKEDMDRAGLLITLALDGEALEKWERVYSVTSFFAGESDDFGYYETRPVIDAVYGSGITAAELAGKTEQWKKYHALVQELPQPQINSVPVWMSQTDEEQEAAQKGFRFMGQRFSLDEAVFKQLVFRQVKDNPDKEEGDPAKYRKLPHALDFPAALGSDTALDIIRSEGMADYPNFDEQMEKARKLVKDAPDSSWTKNLYSSWIYTLAPLIEEKDEVYPPFMRTEAWRRKSLMSFEGSYTELKHDTILYSKQIMGEMGGGDDWEPPDDRGYVEAEPEVWARLGTLIHSTSEGLDGFGMLSADDKESLAVLGELADKLRVIAEKELRGELPTDEEFDLIRSYGGQLEHFWDIVMDAEYPDENWHDVREHPCAIVADIATDPDGLCLECGTGNAMTMYVLVEVDGILKVASGMTYSFYSFEQPIEDRLTDTEWRIKLGIQPSGDYDYKRDPNITYPEWYVDLIDQPYAYEW